MTTPTPQKIRRQRCRFLFTGVVAAGVGLSLAAIFVCSWLWRVLVG